MFATFMKFGLPPYKGHAFQPKIIQLDLHLFLFNLLYTEVNFNFFDPIINLIYISFSIKPGKIKFHI